MSKRIYDNRIMTRYLLGSLPEAETEALDELSVTDDEFADALKVAEKDLVDAYVEGELTGAELEQFKAHYLASPIRREKVLFAQAFQAFAEKEQGARAAEATSQAPAAPVPQRKGAAGWLSALNIFKTPRLALQWGAALAALALLVAGSWLLMENKRLRQQVSQTQERRDALVEREKELQKELDEQRTSHATAEQELVRVREERERLEQELKQEQQRVLEQQRTARQQQPSGPGGGSIASFILTPQMRGAGQLQTINVPPQTDYVTMQLQLEPNDYAAYRVSLLDESGNQTFWRSGSLKARASGDSKTLSISFRAGLLRSQTYVLRVNGVRSNGASEILSDYPFRVVK